MADDYEKNFRQVFEDCTRLVMVVVSGKKGIECQVFDRDSDTTAPYVSFLLSDDVLSEFMVGRMTGNAGNIYVAGATMADLESNLATGEALPGYKLNL